MYVNIYIYIYTHVCMYVCIIIMIYQIAVKPMNRQLMKDDIPAATVIYKL